MPLPQPPFDLIADRVVETLIAIDWSPWLDGSEDEPRPTSRHFRQSYADPDERPALLVEIEGDEPDESDVADAYGVCGELRMKLNARIIIDADLATRISETDKTGFGQLGAYATIAMRALKAAIADPASPLGSVADSVQEAGRGPSADSSTDEGRLEQSIIVGYRVMEEDPTVLLHRGANAI